MGTNLAHCLLVNTVLQGAPGEPAQLTPYDRKLPWLDLADLSAYWATPTQQRKLAARSLLSGTKRFTVSGPTFAVPRTGQHIGVFIFGPC